MRSAFLKIGAWSSLAFIVFVTVSPIGLRPQDILPVNVDRALAFAIMAGLFTLAYPRQWIAILVLTIAGAVMIEFLQYLSPTRHAHLFDALVKAIGALTGSLAARLLAHVLGNRRVSDDGQHVARASVRNAEAERSPDPFAPDVKVLWSSESKGSLSDT
jgi:hypothetical protein